VGVPWLASMALERAWATLDIKAAGPASRTLTGIASTPTLDRQGHIFEIDGASFTNPIPLLLHHDVTQPIGSAILTKRGGALLFEATLPTVDDPGPLRDTLAHVRQLVTAGLLRGASWTTALSTSRAASSASSNRKSANCPW
jgi:hypothetical protein